MLMRLARWTSALVATVACSQPASPADEWGPPTATSPESGSGSERPSGDGESQDDTASCAATFAGRTPLRLLTRAQYGNMLDVVFPELNLDVEGLTAELPPDVAAAGFSNNVGALVDDTRLSQLHAVASAVASRAVTALDELAQCSPSRACAEKVVTTRARRAYRRTLDDEQQAELLRLFDDAPAPRAGMVRLITGMLLSADVLYESESSGGAGRLSSADLASKLSFALWNSVPDDALLAAVDDDALQTDEQLAREFERLLSDPRALHVMGRFHEEWLGLDATTTKDEQRFPDFAALTYAESLEETRRFVDHVVRQSDGTFGDLLTSQVAFVTPALASIYGAPAPDTTSFAEVNLDGRTRRGLLTRVAFLADTAGDSRTSVTERGVALRRKVLCESIPEPGADIQNQFPLLPDDPSLDARELVSIHLENPACASCHTLMDPVGLMFERYDAIGAYRAENANGDSIDAQGEIVRGANGPSDAEGAYADALELSDALASSTSAQACYADQWFRFLLGRAPEQRDDCSFRTVQQRFVSGRVPIADLLRAIVLSPSFRLRERP